MSLKLHGRIELVMYLMYPSITIITLSVIKIIVGLAESVHEGAALVVRNFREIQRSRSGSGNYFGRKVRSLRVPRICFGINSHNFFFVDGGTKTVYYRMIVEYVINALLVF
jgi:hypothetical protein